MTTSTRKPRETGAERELRLEQERIGRSMVPKWARKQALGPGSMANIRDVPVNCAVDLSSKLLPGEFDRVVRTISEVVERSASLSLDDAKDREVLTKRLWFALGAVIED